MITALTTSPLERFWELADDTRLSTEIEADSNLKSLQGLSLDQIKSVCIQYRFFVERYPNSLALLVAKLPQSAIQSSLAQILSDELGEGDLSKSHLQLWDNFLISLGVDSPSEQLLLPQNQAALDEIEEGIRSRNYFYGIGIAGMAGECLCQVHLTHMHKYLFANPMIAEFGGELDLEFWDLHISEHDVSHRELVRKMIADIVHHEPDSVQELTEGYIQGKKKWDAFWEVAFANCNT